MSPRAGGEAFFAGESELITWLAACLPDYRVPSAIRVLEVLAVTPNGKVDRRDLAPGGRRGEMSSSCRDRPCLQGGTGPPPTGRYPETQTGAIR
jgi:hypothetical protein